MKDRSAYWFMIRSSIEGGGLEEAHEVRRVHP